MAVVEGGTDGLTTPIAEAVACLGNAPALDSFVPGDKVALGQIGIAISAALEHLPDNSADSTQQNLRLLLLRLTDLAGMLMLDEIAASEAGSTQLFSAVETLQTLAAATIQDTLKTLHDALEPFCPIAAEETSAAPKDVAAEAPPSRDKIAINSEEDAIIYHEFIAESTEHLERIESRTLEIESSGIGEGVVDEMFRCFHSIKGAAGFLGLTVMNLLCHEVETMLDRARKATLQMDREVIDVILISIDVTKNLLVIVEVELAQAEGNAGANAEAPTQDIRPVLKAIEIILNREVTANRNLDVDPDPSKVGGALVLDGAVSQDDLGQALSIQQRQQQPLGEILVGMGAASQTQVSEAIDKTSRPSKSGGTIKVGTERLDALIEMVGELVIAESLVEQDELVCDENHSTLAKNIADLSKITRNLQELAMSMRMVPVRQTFQKMHRLVRDTARKTGKEVALVLSGEDTEIDKTVIEKIADPLVHLLRNAVDHGIELPEDRITAGKSSSGTVHLNASHQGGNVVIEVSEDGAGVDTKRVLDKALRRELAFPDQEYTDDEILQFLFQPGFSTHEVATDISGRGVGMDVVRRNVEGLGGRVDIASTLGQGTTFTVRLPLTMAIVDGMILRVGNERYVLPTLSIEESIRPRPEDINTIAGKGEVMMVRGDLVPLIHLQKLFAITGKVMAAWEALVVIISVDGRRCGVVVDELLGQQQVVIKNLGQRLKGIEGISGGCILGDGRVGLILDAGGMIRLAGQGDRIVRSTAAEAV